MNIYLPSKRSLIISIGVATLSIISFVIFICITFSKLGLLKTQIRETNNYAVNIENVLSIKKEQSDLKDQISNVDGFFVKPGEEPYFVDKVEAIGRSLGLKIQTDSILEDKAPTGGFKTLSMSFSYEGDLNKVLLFLNHVEEMPYAVSLQNVNMNLTDSETGIWSGSASISVYKNK